MLVVVVALRVDFDSAAERAADQQEQLSSTSASLNTITIGLIAWAVAISVAVAVMATLIVRRMRVLRARAERLAVVKRRHVDVDDTPYDAELDTDSRTGRPPSECDRDATSIVDVDLNDTLQHHHTVGPQPQQA